MDLELGLDPDPFPFDLCETPKRRRAAVSTSSTPIAATPSTPVYHPHTAEEEDEEEELDEEEERRRGSLSYESPVPPHAAVPVLAIPPILLPLDDEDGFQDCQDGLSYTSPAPALAPTPASPSVNPLYAGLGHSDTPIFDRRDMEEATAADPIFPPHANPLFADN